MSITATISDAATIGTGVTIQNGVTIGDNVTVGDGAIVGRDAVLLAGSILGDNFILRLQGNRDAIAHTAAPHYRLEWGQLLRCAAIDCHR